MKISFILLCYNQEKYIKEALISVINQECQPLEVIVSDDCSIDNTSKVIQEVLKAYDGIHKVIFNRNDTNLGIAKHFNKVVTKFCQGDIILTADGDDISFPERTQRTLDLFTKNPEIMGLSFDKILIDKNGLVIGTPKKEKINISKYYFEDYISSGIVTFCGSSRAFKREVMDFFGPLNYSDGNDIFIFNRCLMMGGYLFSNEKMIYYRIHEKNTDSARNYTINTINKAKAQLFSDLHLAVAKELITPSDSERAIQKRIKPIIKKFNLIHTSFYHPSLYKLILLRRHIKKFIKKYLR